MQTLKPADRDYWKHIVQANNKFGVSLLAAIAPHYATDNVLISPTGIFLTLSMLYNGLSGMTYQKLQDALQLPLPTEINPWNKQLLNYINLPKAGHEIHTGSALWFEDNVRCFEQFVREIMDVYGSQLYCINFGSAEAVEQIDYWAQTQTGEKITRVVDAQGFNSKAKFAISDLFYFYAQLDKAFSSDLLAGKQFYRVSGHPVPVDMMQVTELFAYWEDANSQCIKMPYRNSPYSLFLALPRPGANLGVCVGHMLAPANLFMGAGASPRPVHVELPRLDLSFCADLNRFLPNAGLGGLVSHVESNDFSLIAPDLSLGGFFHAAALKVNEISDASPQLVPAYAGPAEFSMEFNRPFLLAVIDNNTGQVINAGAVLDPSLLA